MLRIIDGVANYEFPGVTVQLGTMKDIGGSHRELVPTAEFWRAWKNNRYQMKRAGFYCIRIGRTWQVLLSSDFHFEEIDTEMAYLESLAENGSEYAFADQDYRWQ